MMDESRFQLKKVDNEVDTYAAALGADRSVAFNFPPWHAAVSQRTDTSRVTVATFTGYVMRCYDKLLA